jgi:hypothetical protein
MSDERAGRKASWSLMADVIQPAVILRGRIAFQYLEN